MPTGYCRTCIARCREGVAPIRRCQYCKDRKLSGEKGVRQVVEAGPVTDDAGTPVPEHLVPIFQLVPTWKRLGGQLAKLAENWNLIVKSGASLEPLEKDGKPFIGGVVALKSIKWREARSRPALICPECNGNKCPRCLNTGYWTDEMVAKYKEGVPS